MPPFSQVRILWIVMVVVVIALVKHQEIEKDKVPRSILHLKRNISQFMSKPVDNCPMNRADENMYRQEKVHPPMGSKSNIKSDIKDAPCNAGILRISDFIEAFPFRYINSEASIQVY